MDKGSTADLIKRKVEYLKILRSKFIYISLAIVGVLVLGLASLRIFRPDWFAVFRQITSEELTNYLKSLKQTGINPKDYFVYRAIPVPDLGKGTEGKVEMLIDKKLENGKDAESMAETVDGNDVDDPKGDWKLAVIRLSDLNGVETDKKLLDNAVAVFKDPIDLYGDGRLVYRVDERYKTETNDTTSTDMVEIANGKMRFLSMSPLTDSYNPHFHFMNNWKFAPARSGKGKDILVFETSQVNEEKSYDVEATYIRYFFDGKDWVKKDKDEKIQTNGDWETFSSRFPVDSFFP